MAYLMKCDNCGKTTVNPAPLWYEVRRMHVSTLGEPDAWHFCTEECMANWAKVRVQMGSGGPQLRPNARLT